MGWNRLECRARARVGLLLLAGSALVSCQQSGPYLYSEQYVTRGGQEELTGSSCMSSDKGNGMSGGLSPDQPGAGGDGGNDAAGYAFSYDGMGDAVRLRVVDPAGNTLADTTYDRAFLESGRKDEVTVDVAGGNARFVAWGVPDCDSTQ